MFTQKSGFQQIKNVENVKTVYPAWLAVVKFGSERVIEIKDYSHTAAVEFSTGWKIWPHITSFTRKQFNIFALFTRNFERLVV